jgi:hypothetical protein
MLLYMLGFNVGEWPVAALLLLLYVDVSLLGLQAA